MAFSKHSITVTFYIVPLVLWQRCRGEAGRRLRFIMLERLVGEELYCVIFRSSIAVQFLISRNAVYKIQYAV